MYRNPAGDAYFYDAWQTWDGGYIVAGALDTVVDSYAFLMKTDCNGDQEWLQCYGAGGFLENFGTRIAILADSGYLLATHQLSGGEGDIVMVRVDQFGTTIWNKTVAAPMEDRVYDVVAMADGSIVLGGETKSYGTDSGQSNPYPDMYLLKLDASGNEIWSKTIGNPQSQDRITAVSQTPDGGLVVAGKNDFAGLQCASVVKIDSNGNVQWHKGISKPNAVCHYNEVIPTSDGGYLAGGFTNMENPTSIVGDAILVKMDSVGDTSWVKIYHGSMPNSFDGVSGLVERGGMYHIMLSSGSYTYQGTNLGMKFVLLTVDLAGNPVSATAYNGGGSLGPVIRENLDHSILISGMSIWPSYGYNNNLYMGVLLRLDSAFNTACNEVDVTAATFMVQPGPIALDVTTVAGSGSNIIAQNLEFSAILDDSLICEQARPVQCDPIVTLGEEMLSAQGIEIIGIHYEASNGVISLEINGSLRPGELLEVDMVNLLGQTERLLSYRIVRAGRQRIALQVGSLPSGIWYLRLRKVRGSEMAVKPFVVME